MKSPLPDRLTSTSNQRSRLCFWLGAGGVDSVVHALLMTGKYMLYMCVVGRGSACWASGNLKRALQISASLAFVRYHRGFGKTPTALLVTIMGGVQMSMV